MKNCPRCSRVYEDDALNFCLDDGIVLNQMSAAPTSENISQKTEQQTLIIPGENTPEVLPTQQYSLAQEDENVSEQETIISSAPLSTSSLQNTSRSRVGPVIAYLAVGLLAILVVFAGIGIVVFFAYNSSDTTGTNGEITKNLTNSDNDQNGDSKILTNGSDSKVERPDSTETPKAEKSPSKKPEDSPEPTSTPDKSGSGKIFVILGSFPPSQTAQAKVRLQKALAAGLNAKLINTNNYSGLRSGLIAVVMGPYSTSEAQRVLEQARRVSGDAYIKSGS